MSTSRESGDDPYLLGRNYQASARLALLHLLIHAQLGYLIHPSIVLPDNKEHLSIADVGTGTGIWIAELTKELPASTRLDGFDISDEQYPPESWYGGNVSLSKLDIFKPLPEELKGKYDIAHLRFFMTVASDDTIQIAVDNLNAMLKPGGYLQWVERDWLSKFPQSASSVDGPHTQLTSYLHRIFPKTGWINNIPKHFEQSGLTVLACDIQSPLPIYRKPWNEENLIGLAAIGDRISDDKERGWFKNLHAQAATDAAKGWYVDWELIVCVGQKKM